jgi:hypothetical protein
MAKAPAALTLPTKRRIRPRLGLTLLTAYLASFLPTAAPYLASVAPIVAPVSAVRAAILAPIHSYGLSLSV